MADVFLSYSRKDSGFVRRLHEALEAAGRESWVDWEGIPPTAEWMEEIYRAIEGAQTFVAVLSPASVSSEVCRAEAAHAAAQGKRLVPIVVADIDPAEALGELARLNWIFFRESDDFDQAFGQLTEALDTDLEHLKLHTWLLVRCGRWSRHEEEGSYLLRGRELATAENWLAESAGKEPPPTPVQSRYVLDGRRQETRRQRRVLGGVILALVVAISLGVVAWLQRNRAESQRKLAVARALATRSELELDETGDGLVRAALLAVESLALVDTDEGEASWERVMRLLPPPPQVESPELGETTAGAIDRGGRLWAAGDAEGTVTLGRLEDGSILERWQAVDTPVVGLAFDADAETLAVGGEGVMSVWNLERDVGADLEQIAEIREEGLELDTFGRVHDFAFSHDGERLYVASEGYGVEVFSTADWRRQAPILMPDSRIFALDLHPRLDALVAGGFGLYLVDAKARRAAKVPDERDEETDTVAFSREGDLVASVDFAARIWDFEPGGLEAAATEGDSEKEDAEPGNTDRGGIGERDGGEPRLTAVDRLAAADERAHALDFTPGGRYLAVARETGVVHVRHVKGGAEVNRGIEGHPVWAVAFLEDGKRIATVADRLRVRPALTGEATTRTRFDADIVQSFVAGDGAWLAVTTRDGRLHALASENDERRSFELGLGTSVVASPDGRWLASMGNDAVVVLDASTLESQAELRAAEGERIGDRLFDPHSRTLVVTGSDSVAVLDLATGEWSRLFEDGKDGTSWRPAWTADGAWLVLAGGGKTHLFRAPGWQSLPELDGRFHAFGPRGERVCTEIAASRGRHPGYLVVWEAATGERLGSVGGFAYLGKSEEEWGEGNVELALECASRQKTTLVDENPRPPVTGHRWSVDHEAETLRVYARQPADRIAEACRRLPRQLTPEEWARLMPDEEYRATCPAARPDIATSRFGPLEPHRNRERHPRVAELLPHGARQLRAHPVEILGLGPGPTDQADP